MRRRFELLIIFMVATLLSVWTGGKCRNKLFEHVSTFDKVATFDEISLNRRVT